MRRSARTQPRGRNPRRVSVCWKTRRMRLPLPHRPDRARARRPARHRGGGAQRAARLARRDRRRPADLRRGDGRRVGPDGLAAAPRACGRRSTGRARSATAPRRRTSTHLDGVVLQAARRGLPVLPIVTGTPGWAASRAHDETSPPREPELYADFLRALVARYGPQGSLWAEHPEVAARPIRDWQIWNEPNLTRYWTPPRGQGFARSYVKLLRAAHRALEPPTAARARSSPGCRTRAGSRCGGSTRPAAAARSTPSRCTRTRASRATSCAWPSTPARRCAASATAASRSGSRSSRGRPPRARRRTRPASRPPTAARRSGSTEGLRLLARARKRLRIQRVFWYTWLSREDSPNSFDYSGLRRVRGGRIVSVPALGAFRAAARRLQGCAKAPGDATRCR